jgi:integrase
MTGAQVDFRAKVVHLAPEGWVQNKKRRPTVPMASALAAELKRWKPKPDEVLVAYKGKAMHRARESFKRLSTASRVPCTAYTIRHTVATELRRRNVPEWDVAGFLGHRGPGSATTARYAHYRPDYMRSSAAAVDRYVRDIQRASLRASRRAPTRQTHCF